MTALTAPGGKIVQEALSRPDVLEGFLGSKGARWGEGVQRSYCVHNRRP
jgi:hypothetical protein